MTHTTKPAIVEILENLNKHLVPRLIQSNCDAVSISLMKAVITHTDEYAEFVSCVVCPFAVDVIIDDECYSISVDGYGNFIAE